MKQALGNMMSFSNDPFFLVQHSLWTKKIYFKIPINFLIPLNTMQYIKK